MRAILKLVLSVTCVVLLCAASSPAFAQGPIIQLSPEVLLRLSAGQIFNLMDANHDGVLQPEEVTAWATEASTQNQNGARPRMVLVQPPPPVVGTPVGDNPPPTESSGSGGSTPLPNGPINLSLLSGTSSPPPAQSTPLPPLCSEELRASEQQPRTAGFTCYGKEGSLFYRTVCNRDGFDTQAIVLPAGRAAGCFSIEAITPGRVVFGIRGEAGPSFYQSGTGNAGFSSFALTDVAPWNTGRYILYIDRTASDPDVRVTISFLDYPK